MQLNPLSKLLARLSLKIQQPQLEKLLACANLPPSIVSKIKSPIQYLISLKKRSASIKEFLKKLEKHLKVLDDAQVLEDLVQRFHKICPDTRILEQEPEHIVRTYRPSQQQSTDFCCTLVRISNELRDKDLEIMIVLSPTPEGHKQGLSSGVKLFEEMKAHGVISEGDTELLDDLLRVLKLTKPAELLNEYRKSYPSESSPQDSFPSIASRPLHSPVTPLSPTTAQHIQNRPTQEQTHLSTPLQESSPLRSIRHTPQTPLATTNGPSPFIAPIVGNSFSSSPTYPRPYNIVGGHTVSYSGSIPPAHPVSQTQVQPSAPPIHLVSSAPSIRAHLPAPAQQHTQASYDQEMSTGTLSSYHGRTSREMFSAPISQDNNVQQIPSFNANTHSQSNSNERIQFTSAAAAKGTLKAEKFPHKELQKFRIVKSNANFAPPAITIQSSGIHSSGHMTTSHSEHTTSTMSSYRHSTNQSSPKERQRSGPIDVVVGTSNHQDSQQESEQNVSGNLVRVSHERSATVPIPEMLKNKTKSLALSRRAVAGSDAPPSVNKAATPLTSNHKHTATKTQEQREANQIPISEEEEEESPPLRRSKRLRESDEQEPSADEMVVSKKSRKTKKQGWLGWLGSKIGLH